ncbi:MAG: phosphopantetheine-binding protein, partial [Acidobacteria bacterium]|nr:phosphopantetheine-binding protein [Acidobacteriota bacterium]
MLKRPELSTTYSPPTDEIQCVLARIWGEFLGFEEVGIGDDFFELGGDSLKAIVIISRINKELKVKIPLDTFFKIPNICELSKYISGLNVQGDLTGTFIPLESVEKKDYYPLTPAQKRMYF